MTDLFVIVHTDADGDPGTLGSVVYPSLPAAEERVAERRRTAEAERWPDRYDVFRLVSIEEGSR